MSRKQRKPKQLELPTWGGRRKGAGRKPRGARPDGPEHRPRERITFRDPVHVTLRAVAGLPSFRKELWAVVEPALHASLDRLGTRIVHYSVQKDHLHLIVEAADGRALSRAIKGLAIHLARCVNAASGHTGRVWAHRFHTHVLRKPREVAQCLVYVLNNARKHARRGGVPIPRNWLDPRSSARWFDGWSGRPAAAGAPTPKPRSWLLATGWRKWGPLDPNATPEVTSPRRRLRTPRSTGSLP
jgi:REP element-mobilizing transposase RayT